MSLAAVAAHQPDPVPASVIGDLDLAIDRAAAALRREQRADGHFAFDLEADATIPSEYVLLKHFLGEPEPAIEDKIAVYLRRSQEAHGGWPLAARRRLQHVGQRQGLFRAEADRRSDRCAAHGAGAGRHPGAWRRGAMQRLHPHHAGAVRRGALARRAGDAGRDHAAAAVVPVPPLQGVVLGARHAGADDGAGGAEAPGAQPARRRHLANCSSMPPEQVRQLAQGRQPGRRSGASSSARSMRCCSAAEPFFPKALAASAPSTRPWPSRASG